MPKDDLTPGCIWKGLLVGVLLGALLDLVRAVLGAS